MKIKGTTTSGFSYEIEKDSLDDYELFELIASGDFTAVPKVIERILGEEQKRDSWSLCAEKTDGSR